MPLTEPEDDSEIGLWGGVINDKTEKFNDECDIEYVSPELVYVRETYTRVEGGA